MGGHLDRFHETFVPSAGTDDQAEDDEDILCLVDKLLNRANDEYTTRRLANEFGWGRSPRSA